MNEEELEKLRENMRELLLSLDINNFSDSEENEESDEEIYDDEWYEPIANLDDVSDQDIESEELNNDDGQTNEDDSELEFSEAPNEDQTSDGISASSPNGISTPSPDEEDEEPVAQIKKKKRKKKSKKKRNYPSADDDLADANGLNPPVPDDLYDLSTCAESRFRLAMDKFRGERYFTAISNQILETYFTFGGMNVHDDVDPSSSANGVEIDYEVDFLYLVSSFLSSYIFESSIWYDEKYFEMAPKVLAAFLKYIRDRKAVPEYRDSLDGAIAITEIAKDEVPKCKEFNAMMPDDVATTCSALYLPEYMNEQLPDNSIFLMEHVVGVQVATEVHIAAKGFQYARVSQITKDEESVDSTATVRVVLEDMVEEGSSFGGGLFPIGKGRFIHMSLRASEKLKIGTVIWGTFYMLSNEVVFARPLVALPSFYVELDEEESLEL
ncbi:hypothetical protein BGX27_008850 [Mortierella sp. AM989]|nr:hypothetical protein BGX27_008850 [Mortierella sp. AM989]